MGRAPFSEGTSTRSEPLSSSMPGTSLESTFAERGVVEWGEANGSEDGAGGIGPERGGRGMTPRANDGFADASPGEGPVCSTVLVAGLARPAFAGSFRSLSSGFTRGSIQKDSR
jgi:hypothetical protein